MTQRLKQVLAVAVIFAAVDVSYAQQNNRRGGLPSVANLIKQLDKNKDGKLTQDEVTQRPFNRAFSRWDANQDGAATEAEIIQFRRRLGIPIEGGSPPPGRPQTTANAATKLTIPDVEDLVRMARGKRVSREDMKNSAFIMATKAHPVAGHRYVVLTDHTDAAYLKPLARLAEHRKGVVVLASNLARLDSDTGERDRLRKVLQEAEVRYVAIAPRMQSYRENMLLGMFELLTTLDEDPQLDAYPGILLASSPEKFASLIDRSISHTPQAAKELRPFAISQVPSLHELRSLQKSGVLRKLFAKQGIQTPTVGVYSSQAATAPKLPGDDFWSFQSKDRGDFLKQFPPQAAKEFEAASLLILHGHGVPGMSCGVDLKAIPPQLSAQVVLCGSCFSASPRTSDFPAMRRAPGGYGVESRDAFVLRTIDNGACVAFGHMRLSQGFPHLYPVLESWLQGKTVGEAYQELVNGIIEMHGFESGKFTVGEPAKNGRQPKQNILLYVVFGDPAVQPFQRLLKK